MQRPLKHNEEIFFQALKVLSFIHRSSTEMFYLSSSLKDLYRVPGFVRSFNMAIFYGNCPMVVPVLWSKKFKNNSSVLLFTDLLFLIVAIIVYLFYVPGIFLLQRTVGHASNLSFLSNVLSGKIDSPTFLSRVYFRVLALTTRRFSLFILI